MALDRIKQLLELMKQHELSELELKEKDFNIRLVKSAPAGQPGPATVVLSAHHPPATPAEGRAAGPGAAAAEAVPEGLVELTSPIVGTLYRAPSPDADQFVEEGSRVEPDSTVCIIEAMKVMNEVKAEMTGIVRKVLVENGQPVEYGQPIFLVELQAE